MNNNTVKPLLRWAGSKRKLIPILSSYWRVDHRCYIEPFSGSACLFFYLQPRNAILGDINVELITTYEVVRDQPELLYHELKKFSKGKDEYYRARDTNPESLSVVSRAARFIYLNRFCFNGLYRTNRKGNFNVPYGGEKSGTLPSKELLDTYSRILQDVRFIAGDFEETLKVARAGDFVYMDPPFRVESRRIFNEYDPSVFSSNDLQRLRGCMDDLTKKGVEFLVSYADCDEANMLKYGYDYLLVNVRRNIAGFASNRRTTTEILISNRAIL